MKNHTPHLPRLHPQKKETQGQLAASARAILDALPVHVALLDSEGVIVSVNEPWRSFAIANALQGPQFGVGQNYLETCDRARGNFSTEARAAAIGIREVLHGESREFALEYPCHAPSEPRWFRLQATPVSESSPEGVVVMHINITDRKLAEMALQESEARFRATFELAAVGIAHVSPEGAFLRVNDKLCAILGYTADELMGRTFVDLTIPEDRAAGVEARRAMLAGEQTDYSAEKRYWRKDGAVVWIKLVTTLERTDGGEPKYFISVFEDITERKMVELRLHRLNRLHTVLSKVGEAIVRSRDRQTLYETVCQIVVKDGRLRMVLVAELDAGAGKARPVAAYGEGLEYVRELTITTEGPQSRGTVGTTFATGRHDICNDFANDPRMAPWREKAMKHGFCSTASFPLKLRGATVGALVLFAGELDYFQDDEISLMVSVANDLSFAIETLQKDGQHRRAENALRASEANMAAAQRIAHFGSWEQLLENPDNPNANPLHWSDEMYRIAGFEPGAVPVTRQLFFDLVHPDDRESIHQAVATAIRERRQYSLVHRLIRRDGGERVVHQEAQIFFDETTGVPLKMIGTTHDITERQRAEQEQAAVVKVASSVSVCSGTEFFEQLARNMAEALGAKAAFVSQLLPGDPPSVRSIAAVVEGQMVENVSYELKDTPCENLITENEYVVPENVCERFPGAAKLGGIGAQAYVGRQLVSSTGLTIGQVALLFADPLKQTDFITSTLRIFAARAASELERQQTDDRLREQAALLDATSDAVLLKDMDDNILFWNRSAEQVYGWSAAEAIGRKSRELLAPEPSQFDPALRGLLKQDHWRGEMQKQTKEGRELTMDVRWTLVRDPYGKPKSILAINTDITEKKKLEAQFLRAQRMESIGTLAGGVAHDLNNVLAPILMAVELLNNEGADPGDRAMLETLRVSAQRGADLVKQVLTFARGVEGERLLINPAHVVREIQKIIRDTFPKNIDFSASFSRDLWTVTGDPTQLHQVLMNFCVNARDAMPQGGQLSVAVENHVVDDVYAGMNPDSKPGPYIMVTVTDSGAGIPVEIRDRVFEPFFTTKDIGKGTGLGLSTTLAIVKSHGGFINLYSEVGKGTRFKIYLPSTTTAVTADQVAIEQTRLPRGNGEVILVVDDEEAIRQIAHRTLDRFGYRVLLAVNGAEAIAQYARQQNEIAVVLTDMAMPIMDGPATIIALRALNPHVKIIGSSGLASSGGVAKAVGAGVKHFVPKPYTAETILRTIATILKEGAEERLVVGSN